MGAVTGIGPGTVGVNVESAISTSYVLPGLYKTWAAVRIGECELACGAQVTRSVSFSNSSICQSSNNCHVVCAVDSDRDDLSGAIYGGDGKGVRHGGA